jgi:hypothetical protein
MTITDLTISNNAAAMHAPAAPFGPVTSDAIARLGEWVTAASQAHQLLAPLIDSAFIPDSYRTRVAPNASAEEKEQARAVALSNAVSAVLLGLNLGLDPMTALQQIILIKGRPGMYARAKVAILQSRGYDIWTETLTDDQAVVCVVRPGSDRVERFTITSDMAKKAGWTSNEAYAKTPQDMLWARAAGRGSDRTGAHILLGIPSVEDIPDLPAMQVEAHVGPRVTRDTIRAEPQLAADPSPVETATVVEDQPDPVRPVPERVTPKASAEAVRKLWSRMKPHGLTSADLALEWFSQMTGRHVDSREDLTTADLPILTAALDELDRREASPPDGAP